MIWISVTMANEHLFLIHRILLICVFMVNVKTDTPYADVRSDYETLLLAYQVSQTGDLREVIPKNLTAGPMIVYLGLSLHSLLDFDTVGGSLHIGGTLHTEWQDEIKDLAGLTFKQTSSSIPVTKEQIWTPDLVAINGQDFDGIIGDTDDIIRYNTSTGDCKWDIALIMNVACTPDMSYFPYDVHNCELTIRSWLQDSPNVKLKPLSNMWNTDFLEASALWDVTKTSTESATDKLSDVVFKIKVDRKPHFFAIVILTPVLIISIVSLFLFLIPPFTKERVGFSVTSFLSFVILLEYLTNIIPAVFFPVSFICIYVFIMLLVNVSICIVNVVMMRIHFGTYKGKVPDPLQKFINLITFRICRPVAKNEKDVPPSFERQDTVFNIKFPSKALGEDLNGEMIEEEDSVFELSDTNDDGGEKKEHDGSNEDRKETNDKNTETEIINVGKNATGQSLDGFTTKNEVNTTNNHVIEPTRATNIPTNDPDRDSISSLETTYTTRSVAIRPSMVERGYTLSFNTYLPRTFMSNKLKTSVRHDVIGRRSRYGNKGQKRKTNVDITPVEHSISRNVEAMIQTASETNTELNTTYNLRDNKNERPESNDEYRVDGSVSDRSDRAYVSASDSKIDTDDGRTISTRYSSSTKTRTISTSSAPAKVDGMTWTYVGQVLDNFFMLLFAVIQVIFTVAFIIPISIRNE